MTVCCRRADTVQTQLQLPPAPRAGNGRDQVLAARHAAGGAISSTEAAVCGIMPELLLPVLCCQPDRILLGSRCWCGQGQQAPEVCTTARGAHC